MFTQYLPSILYLTRTSALFFQEHHNLNFTKTPPLLYVTRAGQKRVAFDTLTAPTFWRSMCQWANKEETWLQIGIRMIPHSPKYTCEAQKYVVKSTKLCFYSQFSLCAHQLHTGQWEHRHRAKTQIMLMNRAQPGLEQEVQEVLDFIIIKFLLSLKVPAQSYRAEVVALK